MRAIVDRGWVCGRFVVACLGVAAVASCSLLDDDPERDPDSGELLEATEINPFDLQLGDCLAEFDEGSEVSTIPAVPCGEPHTDEIYASAELPDGEFPGAEAITGFADDECVAAFAEFVDLPYEESQLSVRYFTPTEESWSDGDREVLCVLADEGVRSLTGTLAGAAR